MKLARNAVLMLAFAVTATACSEDDPSGPPAIAAGAYTVSTFRYASDDGTQQVDLATVPAAQGGPYGILSMTVNSDMSFTGSLKLPTSSGPQTFPIGGDISTSGNNTITIDFDAATNALQVLDPTETGTYTVSGNTLQIVLPNVSFDYGLLVGNPQGEVDSDLTIVGTKS